MALFSLAVSLIILAVYFVVMVVFFSSSADPGSTGSQPEIFIMVGLGVLMIIFGGSLFKSMALRRGGPYIAENLGGRRVNPATSDPDEKNSSMWWKKWPLPPASRCLWPMCWKTNGELTHLPPDTRRTTRWWRSRTAACAA
ncbi:MAG: hypothetical protein R2861_17365 [Desulfobacterales bacterium]